MVYLDNAATTPPYFFSKDYCEKFNGLWLNSNANYADRQRGLLFKAENKIKDCLGVKTGHVLFCRSATEAVEWLCSKMGYCTCSGGEHDSVLNAVRTGFMKKGFNLYLHQYVNQITGEVIDLKQCVDSNSFFGSDFTAAIGHVEPPKNFDQYVDAVWFSGHKFHCEKGIGGIWIGDKLFTHFGGNEDIRNNYGLIHGTVNVAGALAMADAMKWATVNLEANEEKWANLYSYLFETLRQNKIKAYTNIASPKYNHCFAIIPLTFESINAQALQNYLAFKEIYISIGNSACEENSNYRVLKSYGYTDKECENTVRVSFSEFTIQNDIDRFIQGVNEFQEKFC